MKCHRPTPETKSCPMLPPRKGIHLILPHQIHRRSLHILRFPLKRSNLDCKPTPEAKASASCVENDANISVTNKHRLTAVCHGRLTKSWVDENQIEDGTTKVYIFAFFPMWIVA